MYSSTLVRLRAKMYFIRSYYFEKFDLATKFGQKVRKIVQETGNLSPSAAVAELVEARDRHHNKPLITRNSRKVNHVLTPEFDFSGLIYLHRLFKLQESD